MPKIFTELENAFAGPGWAWKPHKSKDHIFLHRSYTQIFSQLQKKYFFLDRKKIGKKCRKKIDFFSPEKSGEFFEISKIQKF